MAVNKVQHIHTIGELLSHISTQSTVNLLHVLNSNNN